VARQRPVIRTIHGAPSWRIANDVVEGWLTCDGGHLGPVQFKTPHGRIQPFSVAPWLPAEIGSDLPGVLRNLRGDFFCMPFGGNTKPWKGRQYPVHGLTSEARWRFVSHSKSRDGAELAVKMRTDSRAGLITKRVRLILGQTVLYCSHEIEGMEGRMCMGHHAMLRIPDREGAAHLACSKFRFGQVRPVQFEDPQLRGYSSLRQGATFRHLRRVPRDVGGYADLTRYPARGGFEDLVLLATHPANGLSWFAVTFPEERYLWFALKNPAQLASTILWHSNGGRHYPPWSGRHRPVLGVEDITGFFDLGLAASAKKNSLSRRKIPTTINLSRDRILRIPYVMGVTAIPGTFETVRSVRFSANSLTFVSPSGITVNQPIDFTFFSGNSRKHLAPTAMH
jgi:hypothetical protein